MAHGVMTVCVALFFAAGCDGGRRSARIDVVTVPAGAVVSCNGEEAGMAPVTVSRLPSGTHLITATLEGHREARRNVSLLEGQHAAVELRLEPTEGLVHIVSHPEDARVFLDGASRGRTPLFLTDVPLGEHRIELQAAGYLPEETVLRVADRTPRQVSVQLTADAGELEVRSDPSGATVRLNGVERGETPLSIPEVPSGDHLIEIRLTGYEPHSERVVLRAQDRREIAATLTPIPTRLRVVTIPSGARIYVANQYRGESPLELTDLRPGEHRVRAELRGFEPSARTVRLDEAAAAVEEFRLVKNSGKLIIVTEPADATVFLNGEDFGTTRPTPESDRISEPLEIDLLPPGAYRVQLSRPGFMHSPVMVRIDVNEVTEIHEVMARRFVVDTRVRIRGEHGEFIREGMLLREFPNGDIELQLETGTIMRIRADNIAGIQALRHSD